MKNPLHCRNSAKTGLVFALFIFHFSLAEGQLKGNYTIDATKAASDSNYLTFSDAAADLDSGIRHDGGKANGKGVSGAVVFNVADGSYDECLHLKKIKGASSANTITFQGTSNDSGGVNLYNSWSDQYNNSNADAIFLDSAQWIVIKNMTLFINTSAGSYSSNPYTELGSTIEIGPYSCNNIITSCYVENDQGSDQRSQYVIFAHGFDSANTFSNNAISCNGFSAVGRFAGCIYFTGAANEYSNGNSFINNAISNVYGNGYLTIYISQQKRFSFINDSVNYASWCSGTTFENDSLINVSYNYFNGYISWENTMGTNLTFDKCPGKDSNNFSIVFNNFISFMGETDNYAMIDVQPGPYFKFLFNNLSGCVQSGGCNAVYYSPDNYNYFENNCIYNKNCSGMTFGTPHMIVVNPGYSSKTSFYMDYNCYYSYNNVLFTEGDTNCPSQNTDTILSAWQSAAGLDKHSVWANPDYISDSNLTSTNSVIARAGVTIPSITTDINHKTRQSPPTIGANEIKGTLGFQPLLPEPSPITLYPNPAISTLTIESGENPIRCITVYDATGRVVLVQNKGVQNKGVQNFEPLYVIDVATLPSGMYIIKAGFDNGSYVGKFVKE